MPKNIILKNARSIDDLAKHFSDTYFPQALNRSRSKFYGIVQK